MLGKLKKRKRARTHGFRKRMSTTGGQNVIKARREKGRWELTPKASKKRVKTK